MVWICTLTANGNVLVNLQEKKGPLSANRTRASHSSRRLEQTLQVTERFDSGTVPRAMLFFFWFVFIAFVLFPRGTDTAATTRCSWSVEWTQTGVSPCANTGTVLSAFHRLVPSAHERFVARWNDRLFFSCGLSPLKFAQAERREVHSAAIHPPSFRFFGLPFDISDNKCKWLL